MAVSANPCSFLNPLASFQTDVLSKINKKFNALQRLAEMLDEAGNLNPLASVLSAFNVDAFLPLGSLDVSAYNAIQQGCPFLNLPPAGGNAQEALDMLRARLQDAYQSVIGIINNHPHCRLGRIPNLLAKFQSEINFNSAVLSQWMACAQAVCAAGTSLSGMASHYEQEWTKFQSNFQQDANGVYQPVNLLTAGAQTRYELAKEKVANIRSLITSVGSV